MNCLKVFLVLVDPLNLILLNLSDFKTTLNTDLVNKQYIWKP